ncbi:ECF transporter S component [Niallia sp. 01092]|uniref:ECF transporter S component n=1 Tax=unclassified Niallia TaxID=2837522 RepID=UPI003FD47FDB
MRKKMNVRTYVSVGMLSGLAYVLMMLNFPIPPFPNWLLIDFSDVPALIAALIFGPAAGILVELIKNIIDYFITGSETGIPVGHMANFLAGVSFILPSYYIYQKMKSKRGMVVGLIISTLSMTVALSLFNYFVLLPVFIELTKFPMDIRETVIKGILPFNLLKGVIISAIFMLIFTKMSVWIQKQIQYRNV